MGWCLHMHMHVARRLCLNVNTVHGVTESQLPSSMDPPICSQCNLVSPYAPHQSHVDMPQKVIGAC